MPPTPDSTLYLVSCVLGKKEDPTTAKDLYCSDWFRKAKIYVEKKGSPWLILSAEHDLIHPDAVIAPYERTLGSVTWENIASIAFQLGWNRTLWTHHEGTLEMGESRALSVTQASTKIQVWENQALATFSGSGRL